MYLKLGSRLTFLLPILLTCSLAFLLTFIDGRREEEGVDLLLKSNDPTPEGGEKTQNKKNKPFSRQLEYVFLFVFLLLFLRFSFLFER